MKNYRKYYLIVFSVILLLLPLIIYYLNFKDFRLSTSTETWGQFGDYLNGTFMPIIALTGVLVTLFLGIISDNRNSTNLKIEQQKQRPLLHIGYFDGESKIRIFIKNKGSGPLIITNYFLLNTTDNTHVNSIFEILPPLEISYNNYSANLNNYVLSADEEMELLSIELTEEDLCEEEIIKIFDTGKERIRAIISKYKIIVEYNDVYGNKMPKYEKSLEWFGRHE